MTICVKCKTEKQDTEFYKSKRNKSGLDSWCKQCHKDAAKASPACKQWEQDNKDRRRETGAKWLAENKEKSKQYHRTHYATHREETSLKRKTRDLANPERTKVQQRKWGLLSKYGITVEQYDLMLLTQNNCCDICKIPFVGVGSRGRAPAVDHNHLTNAVRGILCGQCNKMIGLANEDLTILQNAEVYLKKHSSL